MMDDFIIGGVFLSAQICLFLLSVFVFMANKRVQYYTNSDWRRGDYWKLSPVYQTQLWRYGASKIIESRP